MRNRTQLINYLAKRTGAQSYLEIGTFNREHNFNKINIERKICVDPDPQALASFVMTSDEYFEQCKENFDIIFIDGLHEENQVRRDFENAVKKLNHNGFIVMHDCNPQSEHITHYPRDSREWCGNVYKFAITLSSYPGIDFRTVNFDYGCTVVWKNNRKKGKPLKMDTSWDSFVKHRQYLLRLVTAEEFKETLDWKYWAKKRVKHIQTKFSGLFKNSVR